MYFSWLYLDEDVVVVDNKPILDFNDSDICDSVCVLSSTGDAEKTTIIKEKNNLALTAERKKLRGLIKLLNGELIHQ